MTAKRRTTNTPIGNGKPELDGRIWFCPQCNKQRLSLPIGQEPDRDLVEIETQAGRVVKVYRTVCGYCEQKYVKKYFGGGRDIKAVADMMRGIAAEDLIDLDLPDDKSLEELL